MQPYLLALVVGAVVWEVLGRFLRFPFLPPFSRVVRASWEMTASGQILGPLAASLTSLAVGYSLAALCGVADGSLMGRHRKGEYLLDPYVNAFLASPTLIYVPILFALIGVSRLSQVAVGFIYSLFVIMVNTMTGSRTVDDTLVEMARSHGASERQIFWKITLPAALPTTMAGPRSGMARGVKGMVNGEIFIALVGLGAWSRGAAAASTSRPSLVP